MPSREFMNKKHSRLTNGHALSTLFTGMATTSRTLCLVLASLLLVAAVTPAASQSSIGRRLRLQATGVLAANEICDTVERGMPKSHLTKHSLITTSHG